jgi:hypothetical protein
MRTESRAERPTSSQILKSTHRIAASQNRKALMDLRLEATQNFSLIPVLFRIDMIFLAAIASKLSGDKSVKVRLTKHLTDEEPKRRMCFEGSAKMDVRSQFHLLIRPATSRTHDNRDGFF